MSGVNITSLAALSAQLKDFSDKVKGEVAIEGAAGMALVIYDQVKANAETHKKSGLLESAIYRVYSKDRSVGNLQLYHISWNRKKAPHGHLIEFGTSRAPAYPFVRPALSRADDAITAGQKRMAAALENIKEST